MFKRIIYSIHRVLGTILSILFLIWFLSGFVMIYHTFPKVSNLDKFAYMSPVQIESCTMNSILNTYTDSTITKLVLKNFAEKPVFELTTPNGVYQEYTDTGMQNTPKLTYHILENYASRWSQGAIIRVDTLRELEQWIPFSRLKKDFPIYKFHFDDNKEHQLYVSSKSGEALQFTDKNSRFWSWLGAIPHWIYFTSLRQNGETWTNLVVSLSGLGCFMCIAGIAIGIWSYVNQYRRKKKLETPYQKFVYKWHHILGFVFGLFVFTFVFSGMMSLANVPQWLVKEHNPSIAKQLHTPQQIRFDNYILDYRKILEAYPQQVKSIEWDAFGNKSLYKTIIENRLVTIDASSSEIELLSLNDNEIITYLSQIHNEPITVSLMEEYDNYYVGLTDHLPLPVYKAEVQDADNSTYYINPKNASVRYFNNNSKARKWMYQGLHSFKFKFLAEHPFLWNIVMWTVMIGGTIVSVTGVWLGFRYIKRKTRILKQKYVKR